MYINFRDETRDTGRELPYEKVITFLRKTHDWTVIINQNGSGIGNGNGYGKEVGDSNSASSSNENDVHDMIFIGKGEEGGLVSKRRDLWGRKDTLIIICSYLLWKVEQEQSGNLPENQYIERFWPKRW